jgi:hypothetical protein
MENSNLPVHCACVIHGNAYDWTYVDRLYSMLKRNLVRPVILHVWTESQRTVPHPYIKHDLVEWPGVEGPRKAWWYKIQMFNSDTFEGNLLYFDLDVVITSSIDWMLQANPAFFWTIKDFKYLWRPAWTGINSSVMYWNTVKFRHTWNHFQDRTLEEIMQRYAGDQDFLSAIIDISQRKFYDSNAVQSWRWEVLDGGLDMRTRIYRKPNAGALPSPQCCVVVFHGKPKPHEVQDSYIVQHWC